MRRLVSLIFYRENFVRLLQMVMRSNWKRMLNRCFANCWKTAWNWIMNCIYNLPRMFRFSLHKHHRMIESWNMSKIEKCWLKTDEYFLLLWLPDYASLDLTPFVRFQKAENIEHTCSHFLLMSDCTLLDYAWVWIMYASRSHIEVFSINMFEALEI